LRILGIDPGSEATGFGVIDSDGDRHSLREYGAIRCPRSLTFSDKLHRIYERLDVIIQNSGVETVAVEKLFYAANVRSALQLGHVRGVTILAAARRGLAVHEYSPLEVKQAVVGYGRAGKGQIQQMVKCLLGLDAPPEPHDAADALAVALCHAHRIRYTEKTRALAR
jgi:crossover junction endodeoxyribonuclease RuvC